MLRFAWWNLENLFDLDDDPISKDFEYTPTYGWTQEVFDFKLDALSRGLIELAGDSGLDLFGCCEIEKDTLLQQLLDRAGLGLRAVVDVDGTSDLRGIDTAMAFNPDTLEVRFTETHVVHLRYATRDIFEVGLRVRATGEEFVAIASHWPSRRLGRYRSDPLRIAVAEQIAFIVQRHVKLDGAEYEEARAANDLARVQAVWETPIIIMGDFNDEPADRSVVDHLCASSELDRVIGETNDIDRFKKETADYRATDVFLYNPMWRFLPPENVGTYFLSGTSSENFANRYQVLDQIVVSRGMLRREGLRLDPDSIEIVRSAHFATGSGRPRDFSFKKPKQPNGPIPPGGPKGVSDHLPVTGALLL